MASKNGIHHVTKESFSDGRVKSYCGMILWNYDMPIDLDHAKLCVEQETYIQPCKRCMKLATEGKKDELATD